MLSRNLINPWKNKKFDDFDNEVGDDIITSLELSTSIKIANLEIKGDLPLARLEISLQTY
jgi:hypothetical protein